MSADSVLASGRAAIEQLMVDACTIKRKTGQTEDDAGNVSPVYTQVYDGMCRFQYRGLSAGSPTVGEQRVDLFSLEIQLPITVVDVRVNDLVEATESRDPMMTGRVYRVANLAHKTHFTARRIPLEEVTS